MLAPLISRVTKAHKALTELRATTKWLHDRSRLDWRPDPDLDGSKLQIDGLSHRIDEMKQDRGAFSEAVNKLASLLPDASKSDSIDTSKRLEASLQTAKAAETELKGLQAQLAIRSTARNQAQEKRRQSKAALAAICTQASCVDPKDLAEIERQSAEKQQALRDREKLETRIREDGAGLDLNIATYIMPHN